MSLNIANAELLISHLETLSPEQFDMSQWYSKPGKPGVAATQSHQSRFLRFFQPKCNTAGCIAGWSNIARKASVWAGWHVEADWLGLEWNDAIRLFKPPGYKTLGKYPLFRAIATLKHMVAEHKASGKVVVDWDALAKQVAPTLANTPSDLPAEITRYLAKVPPVGAGA